MESIGALSKKLSDYLDPKKVDQVNKAIYKGLTGDASQIKTFIPNMTSVVRGLSFNNTEAKLLRQIML